jgi:hypothetical protein
MTLTVHAFATVAANVGFTGDALHVRRAQLQ